MKTEYILRKEVDLILAALTPENRLVMRVALHTGLRISDILCLRPEQLKPHFWVTEQKTGKRRQVGLREPLLSDLKRQAGKWWVFASPVRPSQTPDAAGSFERCETGSEAVPVPAKYRATFSAESIRG